jgi:hypothetical protein
VLVRAQHSPDCNRFPSRSQLAAENRQFLPDRAQTAPAPSSDFAWSSCGQPSAIKGTNLRFKSPAAERRHVLCVGVCGDRSNKPNLTPSRVVTRLQRLIGRCNQRQVAVSVTVTGHGNIKAPGCLATQKPRAPVRVGPSRQPWVMIAPVQGALAASDWQPAGPMLPSTGAAHGDRGLPALAEEVNKAAVLCCCCCTRRQAGPCAAPHPSTDRARASVRAAARPRPAAQAPIRPSSESQRRQQT